MQRLLWIGSPFFGRELASCGWQEVAQHNFEEPLCYGWESLRRLAGFTPDVLVVADKSRPPFVLGVEDFPCLTVFYSVDSHIHSWQPWYAQAFDICLVSLHDHQPRFHSPLLPEERVWWFPPFATVQDRPDPTARKHWDCLFVGNVNAATPRRAAFLDALARHLPGLSVQRGNYRQLFPQGRILLNYCEHGDLNFRVFEALGCGGCLVTPHVGHAMERLFRDGEDLLCFVPDAPDAAARVAAQVTALLAEPERVARMERNALAAIDAGHRASHRAQDFSRRIQALGRDGAQALVAARRARAATIRESSLKLPYLLWAEEVQDATLQAAYLAASRGLALPDC